MSISPRRVAYSYLRYSDPKQGDGDSIRRQTARAQEWCQRNGADLDASTYCDPGVSAYRGKHRETGFLAAFLRDVDSGRIKKGSVLVIENMDRLSRESPARGVNLLTGLLLAGVSVVTLAPDELELNERSDLFSLFRGQMSQARGHDESRTKSDRVTAAWDQRKKRAREGAGIVTRKLPAWVRESGGKLLGIPERVRAVKRLFAWALAGRGMALMVRQLEADKVKPWGRAAVWGRAYVHKILTGRAVLGEYQPMRAGEPDGAPIAGYFPVVIDLATWERVQIALAARTKAPGRVGVKVANLFTGLLWDARTRGKMYIAWQSRGREPNRQRYRVLIPASATERQTGGPTFPNEVFEQAMLSFLREIDPADVTGEAPESEAAELRAELAGIDARLASIEAELSTGDVPALSRAARAIESQRRTVADRLIAAQHAESRPLSGVWGEARTLLVAARTEDARLRLRALLQDAIESVWVLVVRAGGHVYCAAQVDFRSGVRRDALITYAPGTRGRKASWSARSAALPPGTDLRTTKGAAAVESLIVART